MCSQVFKAAATAATAAAAAAAAAAMIDDCKHNTTSFHKAMPAFCLQLLLLMQDMPPNPDLVMVEYSVNGEQPLTLQRD
jgi:hypothetical protein